jgi:hypothetical protein
MIPGFQIIGGDGFAADGGGGGGAWEPTEITSATLDAWFDPADAGSFTLSGSEILKWYDQTGNRYLGKWDSTAPSYLNGMIDYSSAVSGLKYFNASTDTGIAFDIYGNSVFALLVYSKNAADEQQIFSATSENDQFRIQKSDEILSVASSSSKIGNFEAVTALSDGSTYFTGLVCPSDDAAQIWLNGEIDDVSHDDTPTTGHKVDSLGCREENDDIFKGKFGDVFYIVGNLSTDDRQKLEGYCCHKYGIEDQLPAGHPYKTSPPQ